MAEIWGAVVIGGATLAKGYMDSKAAGKAGSAAAAGADRASQVQWDMFNQNRADQAPFRAGGLSAFNEYLANLGITPTQTANSLASSDPAQAYFMANPDVQASGMDALDHYNRYGKAEGRTWGAVANPYGSGIQSAPGTSSQTMQDAFAKFRSTPGYQFGLDEGSKALQTSAAASGGLFSGKAGKALTKFGQDYADQQGYSPYMNRLGAAAGIGQTATNQVGAYGQNAANQVGNNLINAGAARASGIQGSANAWGGAIGQGAGLAGYMYGNGAFGGANSYANNPGYLSPVTRQPIRY